MTRRQEEREERTLAVSKDAQLVRVDVLLGGEELKRGARLLFKDRDADGIWIGGVPAESGLAAAELVVAKRGDTVAGEPVRECLERIDVAALER